jgi:hypothetical protein
MRERIRQHWPWLAYYIGLVGKIPGLFLPATSSAERTLTLVTLLVGTILGGMIAWLQANLLWVAVGFLVAALLRANWSEIERRDKAYVRAVERHLNLLERNTEQLEGDVNEVGREQAALKVRIAVLSATDEILAGIHNDPSPAQSAWTARVEAWDAANIRMVTRYWAEAEVAFYRLEAPLVERIDDWRERLITYVNVKIDRLSEIAKRKTKYHELSQSEPQSPESSRHD